MARSLVFKFGGACLLELSDFRTAAAYLRERLGASRQAVAVVSAMSGTSGNLEDMVGRLNPGAPPFPAAAAIGSADQLSAALLAVALAEAGLTAFLVPFHATGLTGAGNPLRARLASLDETPLRAAIAGHQVAVLPGGQGASGDGQLMMFGRNSSDLSAVAAAVAVQAERCEILSGLPGIYSADPRLVPGARLLPQVRYDAAAEMARSGAKVLHEEAIRLAAERGLPISCQGWPPAAGGTVVAAAGEWHAAVVANPRWRVWEFASRAQSRAASDRLTADGIASLAKGRHLAAEPGEASMARPAVHRICRRGRLTDLRLLSVLEPAGPPAGRRLIPAARLVAAACAEHQRLYPVPAAAEAAAAGPAPRSPFSRVLFEASAGQAGPADSE